MIEQLSYSVRFPPTDHYPLGRAFDRNITFSPGMTGIVGPNEVGKTFVLEMIEFLIFGSAALRGKAEDYKHLRASGSVKIRGVSYEIERTHRNAAIRVAGKSEPLAVGTKPVNSRILQLLGYGLDVFRVANVANQGDAERLSRMKPTERKAMVDKLIGADQIEAIGTWCGEQALGVSREIAGLETGLVEPIEPMKPEGYEPALQLQTKIAGLRQQQQRAIELRAFLQHQPVDPIPLGDPPLYTPFVLDEAEEVLQLTTYDFDLEAITAQSQAWVSWTARQEFEKAHPHPALSLAACDEQIEGESLQRELVRLRKSPTLTCPCGKPFTTADAEIARVEQQLSGIPMLKGVYDFARERTRALDWASEATVARWEELKDAVETTEPEHHPREAKGAIHVGEVHTFLAERGLAGWSLSDVRKLQSAHRIYADRLATNQAVAKHKADWETKAVSMRAELAAIDTSALEGLEQLLLQVQLYDAQAKAYRNQLVLYDERSTRLTELRAEQASWKNGRTAMNELRADTKNFIVPALSHVASYLLSQMTGGARTRIVVDEDFEIQVDGQPLNTLSGSGKVCANLAIRLGLGRVLTNGVFPVFMGDEMDASMDDDRAEHLHTALVAMQGKLSQIMVITHKQPSCTQVIRLEN